LPAARDPILISTGSSQHLEAPLDTALLFLRDGES